MILKFKGLKSDVKNHQIPETEWWFYDNFKKIRYSWVKYGSVKEHTENYYTIIIPNDVKDDENCIEVCARHGNDEIMFLLKTTVFILNDDGKTIEHLM